MPDFWENVCTLCGPMLTTSLKIGGKNDAKLNCKLCQFNLTCRYRIVMHYNSLQLIKYTRSCQQGHKRHLLWSIMCHSPPHYPKARFSRSKLLDTSQCCFQLDWPVKVSYTDPKQLICYFNISRVILSCF